MFKHNLVNDGHHQSGCGALYMNTILPMRSSAALDPLSLPPSLRPTPPLLPLPPLPPPPLLPLLHLNLLDTNPVKTWKAFWRSYESTLSVAARLS